MACSWCARQCRAEYRFRPRVIGYRHNLVPVGATAIAYKITITGATGPNYVSVTPGDAATFAVSSINFHGVMDVVNGATVAIAADCTIKAFGGDQTGSTRDCRRGGLLRLVHAAKHGQRIL